MMKIIAVSLLMVAVLGIEVSGSRVYATPAVYGHWSYWSEWTYCSASCGGGTQSRTRDCQRPHYGYGDYKGCEGDDTETQYCNTDPCPVDGAWAEWEAFSDCSVSCGGGEMSRSRTCTNPEPAHGGADCEGDDSETESCNEQSCPVDGAWAEWEAFSDCSVSCGGGEMTRSRTCTNPEPAHGGADCEGDDSETESCNDQSCPVDGAWSEWGAFGDCSVDCGHGTKTRSRTCSEPEPAHGGADCYGEDTDSVYCYMRKCPVDGMWSRWSYWSTCSGNCGEGHRVRSRSCSYPAPAHGGEDCKGDSNEVETCQHYNKCGYRRYYPQGSQGHGYRGYGQY